MRVLKIFILFFINATVQGQSSLIPIRSFKIYDVPKSEDTLYKYNSDPNNWYVFFDGGEIVVGNKSDYFAKQPLPFSTLPEPGEEKIFAGRRSVIKVDDGFLVGFDRGEFGGLLYWFSKDGKAKYKIADCSIVQFLMWNNKIYGIEGLAHMFSSRGSILEIDKLVGKWVTNDYLKLPTAPNACRLDSKNNLIVVTSSSLLSIDSNKIIKIIIKKGIWDPYLYPRSMVIQNDIVFIGMRKGVFKFNLLTNQEQWLLPF